MADTLTPERRSDNMSRVKGRNTKPELLIRSLAHRLGYRFRLHRTDLPGKPDLFLTGASRMMALGPKAYTPPERELRASVSEVGEVEDSTPALPHPVESPT